MNDAPYFERFSRARQNLTGILDETTLLFVDYPFPSTMNEMLKHEENCENEKCKENGWDKLKVINVEYIGAPHDGVNHTTSTKSMVVMQGLPQPSGTVNNTDNNFIEYNMIFEKSIYS